VTTRTLVILRHAKAAHPHATADFDRPLTTRGQIDAAEAGAWLSQHHAPDLVLCSPARRTRETWHGVALALTAAPQVRYLNEIYTGSAFELLTLVTSVDADDGTVLLIGHNPALSQLSALLDPASADPAGLRTAEAAVHTADLRWPEWGPGAATRSAAHLARG